MNYVMRHGKRFELDELIIPGIGSKSRTKVDPFLKIPTAWKDRLFELGARNSLTIMIGIELHALFFKSFRKPFPLTNVAMEKIGINRHAKYRALDKLQALGLIKVERRHAKSPLITILNYTSRHH